MVTLAHNVLCLVVDARISCIITGVTVSMVAFLIHVWNQFMDDQLSNVVLNQAFALSIAHEAIP